MLDRQIHQPMTWQSRQTDRATTGLLVLSAQTLFLALLLAGIAPRIMPADMPAAATTTITLPGTRTAETQQPAPDPVPVAAANRTMPAPVIAIAPEQPAQAAEASVDPPSQSAPNTIAAATAPDGTSPAVGAGGAAQNSAGSSGVGAMDISAYLARVSRHIEAHMSDMRRDALGRPLPTTFKVRLYLHWRRDGSVMDVRVATTSGNTQADLATMRAVRLSQPLPPIPQEFQLTEIDGELPIAFEMKWLLFR